MTGLYGVNDLKFIEFVLDLMNNNRIITLIIILIVVLIYYKYKENLEVSSGDNKSSNFCRESCSYCRKNCPFRRYNGVCECSYCDDNNCPYTE